MRERFQSPMAMWRLQYHLLGSGRRILGSMLIYGAALAAGAYGCRRVFSDEPLDEVASYMLNALAAIQIFIAIMGGCNAIFRANLRDFDSQMVESHRLTPMSNDSVVLGYLFGATLQMIALYLVGIAVGVVLAALAKLPVGEWIGGSSFILNGAITLWAACLVSGLRLTKPISPAGFIIGAGVLGNAGIIFLPAAGVLFCAYPVFFGFQILTGRNALSFSVLLMIAALNAVTTVFWLSSAAAKYRRPDLPALHAVRGLILLAFWVVTGISGVVIYFSTLVGPRVAPKDDEILIVQWVATIGLSFLVALPAIAGSVECSRLIGKGTPARSWVDRVPSWAVCLIATAVIVWPSVLIGTHLLEVLWPTMLNAPTRTTLFVQQLGSTSAWAFTALAVMLAMFTAREVHASAYAAVSKPRICATALLILLWAAPPLADLLRVEIVCARDPFAVYQLTGLFGCSPLGSLVAVWANEMEIPVIPGLIGQGFLLCLLAFLSLQLTSRKKATVG